MNLRPTRLCFVGSMMGRNAGFITTQGQITADLFAAERNFQVICVSSKLTRLRRLIEIVWTIFRNRKKTDFLILEVYSGLSMVIADISGFLCRRFNITMIAVLHGGNLPTFAKNYPQWTGRVLKRANALVAPSQFLAVKMSGYADPILIIPNVIEINAYEYKPRRKISPKMIWMRSFHSVYNPQMAVMVLSFVRKRIPEATLVMAGVDKGLEAETRKIANQLGLEKSIRFAGFLDMESKKREFSNADIYLNTNRIDNMPVSIIEAFAMGLPVVATDVGGIPYLIKNNDSGLLVPNEDAEAMAEAVLRLIENPVLTERITTNGRQIAEDSEWTSVFRMWNNLFSDLSRREGECQD